MPKKLLPQQVLALPDSFQHHAQLQLALSVLHADEAFFNVTSLKCTTCTCTCMVIGDVYMLAILP